MSKDTWSQVERKISRISNRSKIFTSKNWQYCCVLSGWLSALALLLAQLAMRSFPPVPPSWGAQQVYNHYWENRVGVQASAGFMVFAGGLYLPWAAVISKQMRRIPDVEPVLCDLQLASSAAIVVIDIISGVFLGLVTFRDYGPQLTQLLSDLFWITLSIGWTPFLIQGWSLAWAVFADMSPNPKFPKVVGLINLVAPVVYSSATGVHTRYHGPYAWNGALAFWFPLGAFAIQIGADSFTLIWNVQMEPTPESEAGHVSSSE